MSTEVNMLVLSRILGLLDEAAALLPGPHVAGETPCLCSPCVFRRGYKARVTEILNTKDSAGALLAEADALAFKIVDLELSVRAGNGLYNAGRIGDSKNETLGDVISFLRGRSLGRTTKHVGLKTEREIWAELERVGIPLSIIIRIVPMSAADKEAAKS